MQVNPLKIFLYEKSLYYCISQKQYNAADTLINQIEQSDAIVKISHLRNSEGKTILHLLVDPNLSDEERTQANSILGKLTTSTANLIASDDIEIEDNAGNTMLLTAAKNHNIYALQLFIQKKMYTISEAIKIFPLLENSQHPELHKLSSEIKIPHPSTLEAEKKSLFEKLIKLAKSKKEKDFDELKQIIENELDGSFKDIINRKNDDGYSAVLIAAKHENLNAMKLLLEHGGVPDITVGDKGNAGREVYAKISAKVHEYENEGIVDSGYKNLKEIRDLLNEKRNKNTIKNNYIKEEEKRKKQRQKAKAAEEKSQQQQQEAKVSAENSNNSSSQTTSPQFGLP